MQSFEHIAQRAIFAGGPMQQGDDTVGTVSLQCGD
jgi:hypothetical protein